MSADSLSVLMHQIRRLAGSQHDGESDPKLLERFLQHQDEQAFAVLMRRYGPLVWSACRRSAGSEQDAEDVFQATFLMLARKAGTIRRSGAIGSWLFGVAQRLALHVKRGTARRRCHEARAAQPGAVNPTDDISWRELRAVLDEELALLPDKYRAPLLLCYLQGLTQDEAAGRLGWTKRSVKDRLERGRNRLHGRLVRRGLTLSSSLTVAMVACRPSLAAIPARLTFSTVKAANAVVLGQSAVGIATAKALALAKGGMNALWVAKVLAVTLSLVAVAGIGGTCLFRGLEAQVHGPKPPARVQKPAPAAQAKFAKKILLDLWGDPLPPGAMVLLGTVRYRFGSFDQTEGSGAGLGFLQDSKTIVLVPQFGRVIQFWDSATGKLQREISTGTFDIRSFALSLDAKQFAISGFFQGKENPPTQGAIRIWESVSGKEIRTFERKSDRDIGDRQSLAFSADGKLLFSLGKNGILRVEEIATGGEIGRHQFPRYEVPILAVSPDGNTVAVGTQELRVFQWRLGGEPREIKLPAGKFSSHIVGLTFSPDGTKLAVVCLLASPLRIWDVESGRLLHKLELPDAVSVMHTDIRFSSDGETLIERSVQRGGCAIHRWNVATGEYQGRLETGSIGYPAISPDRRLLAGGVPGVIHILDLATGKEIDTRDEAHQGNVSTIEVTGNVVVTAGRDNTLRIWEGNSGKQVMKLGHAGEILAVALAPDGTKLASSSRDDTVCLWEISTGRTIFKFPGHGRQGGGHGALRFTSDGKHLLSLGYDLKLRKWDTVTGIAVLEKAFLPNGIDISADPKKRPSPISGCELSPNGKTLVLHAADQFHVFDVASGKELFQMPCASAGWFDPMSISPDNRLLLASWRAKTIEMQLPKPDGNSQYKSEKDHPVCLFEIATGKLRKQFNLPGSLPSPVAFSPDGKFFAAAGGEPDAGIWIWDTATAKEVARVQGFRGSVQSLAFTPDGGRLISGMHDTTALVWDLGAFKK